MMHKMNITRISAIPMTSKPLRPGHNEYSTRTHVYMHTRIQKFLFCLRCYVVYCNSIKSIRAFDATNNEEDKNQPNSK